MPRKNGLAKVWLGRYESRRFKPTMNAKPIVYALAAVLASLASGCTWDANQASKSGQGKGSLASVRRVKTTAYTQSEPSHRAYGCANACGGRLCSGAVASASADWSRYPVGTHFKVKESGQEFVIDDYGSALVGTN